MIEYAAAAVVFLLLAALLWGLLKKVAARAFTLLVNSVAGLLILGFLNAYLGWSIPVNLQTLLVCGLFGIPGVGALVVLHLTGMV